MKAFNSATASENKIHDTAVARTYGFEGGLVPGVTVFAYMTEPVVATWGRDWFEGGTMSARFAKPFYEGERGTDLGKTSWPAEHWKLGGATVWGWITYDPESNLIFYGTANPGSWNPDLRPGDIKHSHADIARAREHLGYQPRVTFEEGLRSTIEWYRNNLLGPRRVD